MKHQKMTLFEAHDFVWNRRRIIHPNPGFWKQMIAYEKKLYGRNTVKMVNTIVAILSKCTSNRENGWSGI
jgi:hypothetical protein